MEKINYLLIGMIRNNNLSRIDNKLPLPQPTLQTQIVMTHCFHMCVCSVVSDSLQPYRLNPAKLLCPWDFLGKNTGVSCHFLLQGIFPPQESNLHLLHWQTGSLPLRHLGTGIYSNSLTLWSSVLSTTFIPICKYEVLV